MEKSITDLTKEEINHYLSFPEEKLIIAKRKHPFVLLGPIILTTFTAILAILLLYFVSVQLFSSPFLFIGLALVVIAILFVLLTKILVDYYFHFYILTNRKILEVKVIPFFQDRIYDVLLDQVRTTEIDVEMPSVIHKFFDMGNVVIEFDRPSHEERFILRNIKDPRSTETILSKELEEMMHNAPVWFLPRDNNIPRFHEDVYHD